jgi:hypothetical protein
MAIVSVDAILDAYGHHAAMVALGQLGPDAQEAIPVLGKLTEHRDGFVQNAARAALKQIEKR